MAKLGLFSNPIIPALIGLKAFESFEQGQRLGQQAAMAPDPTELLFEQEALQSGQMQQTAPRPRGIFSTPLMALGLESRTLTARPKDVLGQEQVLSQQAQAQAETMKGLGALRTTLGPEGFGQYEQTPAGRRQMMFATGQGAAGAGGQMLDWSGATPKEAQTRALERYREAEERVAIDRLQIYMWASKNAEAKNRNKANEPPIGSDERIQWDARRARAIKKATDEAASAEYMNNWDAYSMRNKTTQFFNVSDISPIDKSVYKTPRMAEDDRVNLIKTTNQKAADRMGDLKADLMKANDMEKLIPVLFPSMPSTMSDFERGKVSQQWKYFNQLKGRWEPANQAWGEMQMFIVKYVKDVQQHYATMNELNNVQGTFPVMGTDSAQSAFQKMEDVKQQLRMSARATSARDNHEFQSSSAAADYLYNTYGGGAEIPPATESPETPLPTMPEGMAPAPPELTRPYEE